MPYMDVADVVDACKLNGPLLNGWLSTIHPKIISSIN